jgi:hypothetical protein
MSRDFRDDDDDARIDRTDCADRTNSTNITARTNSTDREDRTWSPANRLDLPRSPDRRPVRFERDCFRLRGSESELLATIGAFRAIAIRDLKEVAANATTRRSASLDADLRSLRDQGLLYRHALVMNGRSEHVAVLTRKGRDLLERSSPLAVRDQRFYAGVARPRDLAHDAQLYRVFETERDQLQAEGGIVTRVVLDYELKGEYYRYVHEQHLAGVDETHARRVFAAEHQLPFAGERIHLPDVRIEYEAEDGRTEYRDLELVTEHYSRSQLGGKVSAGFRVYRAAGAGPGGRRTGGGSRRGGSPADPHRLEWIS